MSDPRTLPPPPAQEHDSWRAVAAYPLATAGALIGAGIGAELTWLAAGQGFYAIVLIGLLAGFGAKLLGRRSGWIPAAIAGLVALVIGLYMEWFMFPFIADASLGYFVAHLPALGGFKLFIHAVNVLLAGAIAYFR